MTSVSGPLLVTMQISYYGSIPYLDSFTLIREQSYNCGFPDRSGIIEQFIRQASLLPAKPILILTDSSTPNWKKEDCSKGKEKDPGIFLEEIELTSNEAKLVSSIEYYQNMSGIFSRNSYHKVD